jgi:hypothetical protein
MDGSSISTGVDFNTWFRRQKNAVEFVKNFDWSVPKQPTILDRVCLGIKTVNNKVVFIYLKMNDMSRRKVVWNVWEKIEININLINTSKNIETKIQGCKQLLIYTRTINSST